MSCKLKTLFCFLYFYASKFFRDSECFKRLTRSMVEHDFDQNRFEM